MHQVDLARSEILLRLHSMDLRSFDLFSDSVSDVIFPTSVLDMVLAYRDRQQFYVSLACFDTHRVHCRTLFEDDRPSRLRRQVFQSCVSPALERTIVHNYVRACSP